MLKFSWSLEYRNRVPGVALRFLGTATSDLSKTLRVTIAKYLTKNSLIFGGCRDIQSNSDGWRIPEVEQLKTIPNREFCNITQLLAAHPDFHCDILGNWGACTHADTKKFTTLNSTSREAFKEFIKQLDSTPVQSKFHHVDLLLRRDARSEVSLLVDLHSEKLDPRLRGFYLAPIESAVSRSGLSAVRYFQPSLVFRDLPGTVTNNGTAVADCSACGIQTRFVPGSGAALVCSNPECAPSKIPDMVQDTFHPGGNRHYYGPAVPNMRNVWVGVVDKFTHQGGRVGILNATIFQLFHDPSVKRPKNPKLPSPDPRVQWCLLPFS